MPVQVAIKKSWWVTQSKVQAHFQSCVWITKLISASCRGITSCIIMTLFAEAIGSSLNQYVVCKSILSKYYSSYSTSMAWHTESLSSFGSHYSWLGKWCTRAPIIISTTRLGVPQIALISCTSFCKRPFPQICQHLNEVFHARYPFQDEIF